MCRFCINANFVYKWIEIADVKHMLIRHAHNMSIKYIWNLYLPMRRILTYMYIINYNFNEW